MRSPQLRRLRLLGLAAVALLAAVIGLAAYATDALRGQDLNTIDTRFSIRGNQGRPDDLLVVGIDDKTFEELQQRWPFPRRYHARMIDRLTAAGVRGIAYDVQFSVPTNRREDDELVRAVGRAPGVTLSTTEVNDRGEGNVFGGHGVAESFGAREGNTTVQADPGGVMRHFFLSYDGLTSFPVAAVEAADGHPVDRAAAGGSKPWIDYRGPQKTIETVSFVDVLRGRVPDSLLRGRIVVVGATAPVLQDFTATPVDGSHEMPGSEMLANAIWTVENGFPLQSAPGWLNVLLILLFAAAAPLPQLRLRPLFAFLAAVAAGVLFAIAAQLAFDGGWIVSVVYPMLALGVSAIGALAVTALITAYERQRVRDTFARFVPETVVDDVLDRTDEDLRLVGVRREGTVMFSDLRGFTSFAETLPPDRVIDVLNHYLAEMSDAIMDHGGTLVAYMGDGIMAVFGAPIEQPDHADRALAAAREMIGVRLRRFNDWIEEQGLGERFRMGIGVNSGSVMSGQVGSERRVEYTAVGDTTNTAARLEGMTKGTPYQVFVADSTRALLADGDGLLRVDELAVRGRSMPITVWTLATPDRVGR